MKAKAIVFRPEADADIFALYEYIAQLSGSIKTAYEFTQRVRSTCMKLEYFSERGTMRNEIKDGLRILIHEHKTVIAYFIHGDIVEITNIFHGGRDWESIIANENENH